MPRRKQPPLQNATPEDPQSFLQTADVSKMDPSDVSTLQQKIKNLEAQLAAEKSARSEAEEKALEAAKNQGLLLQREIQEVPTGKMVEIEVLDTYVVVGHKPDDGREILRPKFKKQKVPTYFYKIDLPPLGGSQMMVNGVPILHNQVVECDARTLRSLKEMVYRQWDHDRNIHGNDENAYRPQQRPTISARRMRA